MLGWTPAALHVGLGRQVVADEGADGGGDVRRRSRAAVRPELALLPQLDQPLGEEDGGGVGILGGGLLAAVDSGSWRRPPHAAHAPNSA